MWLVARGFRLVGTGCHGRLKGLVPEVFDVPRSAARAVVAQSVEALSGALVAKDPWRLSCAPERRAPQEARGPSISPYSMASVSASHDASMMLNDAPTVPQGVRRQRCRSTRG